MLVLLARLALRTSSLSIPLALLGFLTLAPAPAHADVCTPFLTGLAQPFPNLLNGNPITTCTTDIVIGASGSITIDHNNTPYTNSGNALIGVINNSGSAVFDLFITGFNSTAAPASCNSSAADNARSAVRDLARSRSLLAATPWRSRAMKASPAPAASSSSPASAPPMAPMAIPAT